MPVLAYHDPDFGVRCPSCVPSRHGLVDVVSGSTTMPDSPRTTSGYDVTPIMDGEHWWSGDAYEESLTCGSCGWEIDASPINSSYCSCNDGCYSGECSACEDDPDDDDDPDEGDQESGCRCDGCKDMDAWQPGDPPPYVEDAEPPAVSNVIHVDSGPRPATVITVLRESLFDLVDAYVDDSVPRPVFATVSFYDPSRPPREEYHPTHPVTWEESRGGETHCDAPSSVHPGGGWHCERVFGHPLPHAAFLLYRQTLWN